MSKKVYIHSYFEKKNSSRDRPKCVSCMQFVPKQHKKNKKGQPICVRCHLFLNFDKDIITQHNKRTEPITHQYTQQQSIDATTRYQFTLFIKRKIEHHFPKIEDIIISSETVEQWFREFESDKRKLPIATKAMESDDERYQ